MNVSTIVSKEKDLEMFVDTLTEALHSAGRKTFNIKHREHDKK
jgi:hypothetical protein